MHISQVAVVDDSFRASRRVLKSSGSTGSRFGANELPLFKIIKNYSSAFQKKVNFFLKYIHIL
jgi:hypothetical protein